MSFSFGQTAGASQSNTKPRLVGNDIYTVKFDGCESQDIKGVKHPDEVYKVLKLKWSNADGSFEHTVFEPKMPEGTKRTATKYTDKKTGKEEEIPQTSEVENVMLLFKHAIDTINPKVANDIDEGTKNLGAADWDALRILVAKILDAGIGVTMNIKLLKNNKGEATFPGYFTGITKESKAYVRNNFIGNKLAFSTYEVGRIANEAGAKPTAAKSYVAPTLTGSTTATAGAEVDMTFDMPLL